MKTSRLLVSGIALLLVIGMFFLPKTVVDNEKEDVGTSEVQEEKTEEFAGDNHIGENTGEHMHALTEADQKQADSLRVLFTEAKGEAKEASLEELAVFWQNRNRFDSAALLWEKYSESAGTTEAKKRAGEAYFEAFTFAMDKNKSAAMAAKAREFFSEVLKTKPEDSLDYRSKMAMTFVSGNNPMQGIMQLREILKDNPKHYLTIFNLGILSIQSGQYAKAVERFEKLRDLYPEDMNAWFYLGLSSMEVGKTSQALEAFRKVRNEAEEPRIRAAAADAIKRLE